MLDEIIKMAGEFEKDGIAEAIAANVLDINDTKDIVDELCQYFVGDYEFDTALLEFMEKWTQRYRDEMKVFGEPVK